MSKTNKAKTGNKDMPVIKVRDSMWGDFTEDQMAGGTKDHFWLPGYSDKRQEFERQMAEYRASHGHGRKPDPLPYRFQCVSVQRANGEPDRRKLAEFKTKGYRPVMWDDADGLGLDLESSSYYKAPDGTVRVGSQQLLVADAQVAARELGKIQQAGDMALEAIDQRLADSAANFNRKLNLSGEGATEFEGGIQE